MCLGALIYSLPQFVFDNYSTSSTALITDEVCQEMQTNSSNFTNFQSGQCDGDFTNRYSLVFFIIGNMLIGFGASPLLPIGASYIDDIIMPKYVPIFFGLLYAAVLLGPALGFGLGSAFLSIYVDFWEQTHLEPTDPAYVGAWWMGFLLSCILCWLAAVPILMFPRLLPNSHLVKKERQKLKTRLYEPMSDDQSTFWEAVRSFPRQVFQVVSIPSWIFTTMAMSVGAFALQGLASFSPLYFETQFNLTSSTASFIGGSVRKWIEP